MKNEKNLKLIASLQYQIQRYQATGNGTMCQLLKAKIRRLTDETKEKGLAGKENKTPDTEIPVRRNS